MVVCCVMLADSRLYDSFVSLATDSAVDPTPSSYSLFYLSSSLSGDYERLYLGNHETMVILVVVGEDRIEDHKQKRFQLRDPLGFLSILNLKIWTNPLDESCFIEEFLRVCVCLSLPFSLSLCL